jgi:hypothetical protein
VRDLRLRDLSDEAAIVTDRYLDSLLGATDRRSADVPSDPFLQPPVRMAATRLRNDLLRVHPSFRFEERLAATLQRAARAQRAPVAAGGEDVVVAFPGSGDDPDWVTFDPLANPAPDTDEWLLPRPVVIGGAVASAALSVAGAAIVAWRLTRGETDPMIRAVRAVNRLRADAARARLA